MKKIFLLCVIITLYSCSRTITGTITDAKTGAPLTGVKISSNSIENLVYSDSLGRFQFHISKKLKKHDQSFKASLVEYYTQVVRFENPTIKLSRLVEIGSSLQWYPFHDLDSLNGEKIYKTLDTQATYKDGFTRLTDLLRNEKLISEKTESNFISDNYQVQICMIIDQSGRVARIEIEVSLPTKVLFANPTGYDDTYLYTYRQNLIKEHVKSLFESMEWNPATENGNKVCSQLSIRFCTP